jgi:tetratricopeptide (TPR) repeat protein
MDRTGFTKLIERRSPWGLVGAYGVAAWVVLQVTDTLASLVGLPLWFGSAVLGLLAAGLVVVLLTVALQGRFADSGQGSPARRRLHRLFSWRNAAVGAMAAFALLFVGAAGYMTLRAQGLGPAATLLSRGVLSENGEIVLADFEDAVGDSALVFALEQAFRVHVSQSPTVRLAPNPRVAEVLERMQVDRSEGLPLDVAREAAIREGWKAVVAGGLHAVGSTYTVSVRLVAAESGEELGAWIETAKRPDDLIPAIERLSVRLRERSGESLASLHRSPPLSRVRTKSLAALRSYTEGSAANSRGDFERCILLMDDAIDQDDTFAMALAGRAACLQNLARDPARQIDDRIRAYGMRDRMTEEERLRFTAVYHQFVTQERDRAIEAWEAYSARYPDRTSALFSLANLYAERREWGRAEELLLRGLELDPGSSVVLLNLAGYQVSQGRMADARATFRALEREVPGLEIGWWRATMSLAAGDWGAAQAELDAARERLGGNPGQRARVTVLAAFLAQTLGRLDEAEARATEAAEQALESGAVESYHLYSLVLADVHLSGRGDTAAAVSVVDRILAAHPLESLDPFGREYLEFAGVLARAGRVDRARALIARWRTEVAPLVPGSTVPHWLRANLAEAEGRDEQAIAEWRLEDAVREDPLPALNGIGSAYDRSGQADSAIVYYRRFLDTPSRKRYASDPGSRARVLERLGGLYEERGAPEEAVPYYRRFVALLKGADPVLQPRVAAVEGRLRALELELPVGAGADSAGDRPGASFLDEERDGSGAAWR